MSDVTKILSRMDAGDGEAAEQLFTMVYAELRRLAGSRMANERPDHTLQPTALVHEAFVRLVGDGQAQQWTNRRLFFASAAEAMRRILVESVRARGRLKRGGDLQRKELAEAQLSFLEHQDQLLAIDEVLDELAREDAIAADLTKLRYFAGMSTEEAANSLGLSRSAGFRKWAVSRAWLQCRLAE